MEKVTELINSVDGNVIEYCILGGIVVLVIILIASIISCVKSLDGGKNKKRMGKIKYKKDIDEEEDTEEDFISPVVNSEDEELKLVFDTDEKIEDEDVSEKIAERIELTEVLDENNEVVNSIEIAEPEEIEENVQKLDIKAITREMEIKMEEEITDVDEYEDEQEKTAIISYNELVQAAAKIEANIDKEEELVEDVVFEFNSQKVVDNEEVVPTVKKFKPTIDISPVFGARNSMSTPQQEEIFEIVEVDDNKIREVSEHSEEFLKNLQDFRSNLN